MREAENWGKHTWKESVDKIKDSLRNQIKEAIEKDDLIKKDDVILINNFIEKIRNELKLK